MFTKDFVPFVMHAKQNTYASGKTPDPSTRPGAKEMCFEEAPYLYIDTWVGGFHFIGEEAVWQKGICVWGMNYYGKMLVAEIPNGFSEFLKRALLQAPAKAPYRGPGSYVEGEFEYHCSWRGSLASFEGEEAISLDKGTIYRLSFHGGEVRG